MRLPTIRCDGSSTVRHLRGVVHPFILQELGESILGSLPSGLRGSVFSPLRDRRGRLCRTRARQLHLVLKVRSSTRFHASGLRVLTRVAELQRVYYCPKLMCRKCGKGSSGLRVYVRLIRGTIGNKRGLLLFSRFAAVLSILTIHLGGTGISFCVLAKSASGRGQTRVMRTFGRSSASIFYVSLGTKKANLGLATTSVIVRCSP